MEQERLPDLRWDFLQSNGHRLVVAGVPSLREERLDRLRLNMLAYHDIPGLLRMRPVRADGETSLHYEITGRRMLIPSLAGGAFSLYDYYSILHRIAVILDDSRPYMLDPDQFMLSSDFIFIGRDSTDLQLAYLPVRRIVGKGGWKQELRALAAKLLAYVEDWGGEGPRKLLRFMNEDDQTVSGLRRRLASMLQEFQGSSAVRPDIPAEPALEAQGIRGQQAYKPDGEMPGRADRLQRLRSAGKPALQPIRHLAQTSFKPQETGDPVKREAQGIPKPPASARTSLDQPASKFVSDAGLPVLSRMARRLRSKKVIAVTTVLLAAAVCLLIGIYPGEGSLYIAVGLTLLWGDALFVAFRIPPGIVMDHAAATSPSSFAMESIRPAVPVVPVSPHTALLAPQLATVLLRGAGEEGEASGDWCLEIRSRDGSVDRLPCAGSRLVIGRGPAGIDYQDDQAGISRVHLEFMRKGEGGLAAKDLGSRNGSLLNGSPMVPYKMYEVTEGDELKLLNRVYIVRKSLTIKTPA